MITFQNTRTGEVVDLPEDPPADFSSDDGDTVRRNRWRRHLQSMDASRRWKRVDDATGAEVADPDPLERSLAELRAEAEERGLPTSGTKAQLRARLARADDEQDDES